MDTRLRILARAGIEWCCEFCCFFFSSRRRHTRCSRDWSSDVCSTDLLLLSSIWVLRRLKLLSPFFAFAAMGVSALLASAELLWRLNPRLGRDPQGPCLREVSR